MKRNGARPLRPAHSALHQANRERDEQGRIVATLEDYEAVRALVEEFVGVSSERGVKPQVRTTVTKAAEFIEGSEHDSITVGELDEVLDVDNNAAWRRLRAAFPYIVEMDWKRERKKQYELGEDLPAESSVLPSTDRILQFCNRSSGEGSAENRGQITDDENRKTHAKLAQNSGNVRGVGEEKSPTNGNYSTQQHADVHVPAPLAKSTQNCKQGIDGCPDPALCTQYCASFANVLNDERAASVARMIRSHAAQCKILDWAVPSPDNSYGWMSELLPEHPSLYKYEVARGLEYVRAEKQEWEDYAEALSCVEYLEESTNPVSAYKAIQEIREDWAGHKLRAARSAAAF